MLEPPSPSCDFCVVCNLGERVERRVADRVLRAEPVRERDAFAERLVVARGRRSIACSSIDAPSLESTRCTRMSAHVPDVRSDLAVARVPGEPGANVVRRVAAGWRDVR